MAQYDAKTRRLYGDQYVAGRDGEVVASSESHEQLGERLGERLERMDLDWDRIVVKYVERLNVVRVY